MTLAATLFETAHRHGDAAAVGFGTDVVLDYAGLAGRVARLAGGLRAAGVAPGDRVVVLSENTPRYVEALYAVWTAGAVAVPVNVKLHGAEIGYILDYSEARLALVSAAKTDDVAAHAPPGTRIVVLDGSGFDGLASIDAVGPTTRTADDLAWLFYTSGTTGRPKGAMLTHGNLTAMADAYLAEVDPTGPGDVLLHAAPMSHGSGLYMIPHVMRGAVNVIPASGGFEPAEIFDAFATWGRVSLFAAPTMVKRLVAAAPDFDRSRVRTIVYGGGPMYVEDAIAALDCFGDHLVQIYGQGESPMTITTLGRADIEAREHPAWRARLESVGRAFRGLDVAVVDEDGRPLPVGETGEVVCRGATVMAGYWRDPEATARALRDGWLFTGDVGALDADGYLTLKDRSKDLIISGGSNIYPREVEEVLLAHPEIREVSVIGRPDPEWGEVVVAYVVGTADPASLDALCLARIARFKRPKHYVFVEGLPKNAYGKVLKTDLRRIDRER